MSAVLLVQNLERLGVRLRVEQDQLVVDAPRGVLTADVKAELAARKSELFRLVRDRTLDEVAANLLPRVRFTIRETGDTARDFELLGRVRELIQEFQPGGNRIHLSIVTLDGRRVVVEWRAVATRQLRMGIADVLARAALSETTGDQAR